MAFPNRFVDAARMVSCRSQTDKLVLLALACEADARGRVRVDPNVLATKTALPVSKVEGALASLHRAGHIDARRWEDSGCWSARFFVGGVNGRPLRGEWR